MDGISAASSIWTLVELSGKVIGYIRAVKDAPKEKQKLLQELIRARGLLLTLDQLSQDESGNAWTQKISSLRGPDGSLQVFNNVVEELAQAFIHPSSSAVSRKTRDIWQKYTADEPSKPISDDATLTQRLTWPLSQSRVVKLLKTLEGLKSEFLIVLTSDNVRLSNAIREEVRQVRTELLRIDSSIDQLRSGIFGPSSLTAEQMLVVKSLSKADFSHQLEARKFRRGAEWLLQHNLFQAWCQTPARLLITGGPGFGKTTVCHIVRSYLEERGSFPTEVCTVQVFFGWASSHTTTIRDVLAYIIQQLIESHPYCMKIYNDFKLYGGPPQIEDSLKILNQIRQNFHQFFVILDALDECPQSILIDLIEKLSLLNLRIFATSRRVLHIGEILGSFTLKLDMQDAHSDADLERFTRHLISETFTKRDLPQPEAQQLDKIVTNLSQASNGMYLWVKATIDWASSQSTSQEMFVERLAEPPWSLHHLYEQTIEDIKGQEPTEANLGIAALRLMTKSPSFDTLAFLEGVAAEGGLYDGSWGCDTDEKKIKQCLNCCSNLIVRHNDKVRLMHLTLQDYLKMNKV